jgi:DNA-binding response OmpR family regulator
VELLIAHADAATRIALARVAKLSDDGALDISACSDGNDALERLLADEPPAMAVIEWDLPGVDGIELCRLACQFHEGSPPYIILLAGSGHDIAAGLDAGAGDCLRIPAANAELRARIDAGRRIATMLAKRPTAADEPASAAESLVAQRSPFDDQGDEDVPFAGAFQLQSVLVVE